MSLANSFRGGRHSHHGDIVPCRSPREDYQVQPKMDAKTLARAANRESYQGGPPTNLGRIQRDKTRFYVLLIRAANALSGTTRPWPQPAERKVLERYQGFVVDVEGPWANVTLTTDQGEEFVGTYPALELAAQGIGERDRFTLETIERGATVEFDIKLVPRRVVSPAEQHAIREAIVRDLGDYSPGNDY